MMALAALLPVLTTGCAHHVSEPLDTLDWDLHPRVVQGLIHVAPVIVAAEAPTPDLTGIVGERLDDQRAAGRLHRTAQLAELPYAVHDQVPGALYATLPREWKGTFRDARLSIPDQARLTQAVAQDLPLSPMLSRIAKGYEGDAVLFTWVVTAEGQPLTDEHLVGELVFQDGVPVLVDHQGEPYAVQAELGVALVATDGEILFRYQDHYQGLLMDDSGLAHDMAHDLVADIAPLWLNQHHEAGAPLAQAN